MLRALTLTAIICVYYGMRSPAVAETLTTETSSTDSTFVSNTNVAPSVATDSPDDDDAIQSSNEEQQEEKRYYHPVENSNPRVIEEFSRSFLDGSYEYKYVLSNGVTRYEKSYWKQVGQGRLLARKGFYSHPLTNHKYLTVFYTADEHGYQHDTAKYTNAVPTLPKHIVVAQLEFPHETSTITTTTTRRPATTRKRTTQKPTATTTQRPSVKPFKFNWIY